MLFWCDGEYLANLFSFLHLMHYYDMQWETMWRRKKISQTQLQTVATEHDVEWTEEEEEEEKNGYEVGIMNSEIERQKVNIYQSRTLRFGIYYGSDIQRNFIAATRNSKNKNARKLFTVYHSISTTTTTPTKWKEMKPNSHDFQCIEKQWKRIASLFVPAFSDKTTKKLPSWNGCRPNARYTFRTISGVLLFLINVLNTKNWKCSFGRNFNCSQIEVSVVIFCLIWIAIAIFVYL